jgi:tryptophan synthase alpha chain
MRLTTGLDAIHEMFATADAQNRAAFLPYFTMGFPNYETSLEIIVAMSEAGVDGFEVGIPFSDPLADGPTIQMSSQIALEQGMNVQKALEAVRTLRSRGDATDVHVLLPQPNHGVWARSICDRL